MARAVIKIGGAWSKSCACGMAHAMHYRATISRSRPLVARPTHRAVFIIIEQTVIVLTIRHGDEDRLRSDDLTSRPVER